MELLKTWRVHGGELRRYKHASVSTACDMTFSIFLPPCALAASGATRVPLLYFLSGLTCTDANFAEKAGAFAHAAAARIAIVLPDTSPRGVPGVPGADVTSWDFGFGAGFYVDATVEPWARHWRMESYVMRDLPAALRAAALPVDADAASVCGHSMGGYGALAPIAHAAASPWGAKALAGYLGGAPADWARHDPTALVAAHPGAAAALHLKIDVGAADEWGAKGYLLERDFLAAAAAAGVPVDFASREGYDHGYFFVASFIADHIAHHARFLHRATGGGDAQ
jgi:S-formylglutathione hydrolase